jgi:hypothetical protein
MPGPQPARGSAGPSRGRRDLGQGKAAVVIETSVTDLDSKPLWSTKRSIFAHGEGGFDGERGPSTNIASPD